MSNQDSSGEDPLVYDEDSQRTFCEGDSQIAADSQLPSSENPLAVNDNSSQDVFMSSPVYDPPDNEVINLDDSDDNNTSSKDIFVIDDDDNVDKFINKSQEQNVDAVHADDKVFTLKRKAISDAQLQDPKILKQDTNGHYDLSTQDCDNEVMHIYSNAVTATVKDSEHLSLKCQSPQKSRVLTPVRCSPRKVKRSNSCTLFCCDETNVELKRTPKKNKRCASVDLTKANKLPISKINIKFIEEKLNKLPRRRDDHLSKSEFTTFADKSSLASSEDASVNDISTKKSLQVQTIIEESNLEDLMVDSQDFRLELSPTPPVNSDEYSQKKDKCVVTSGCLSTSEPIVATDRSDLVNPDKTKQLHSAGYNYSVQNNHHSQGVDLNDLKAQCDKGTDEESTDSVSSKILDSPEFKPATLTNKMISNITKNNTSTPSSATLPKKMESANMSEGENTPDPEKLLPHQRSSSTNESYRTVTPSTISPLQTGHSHGSLPANTPGDPVFDIQLGYDETGDFISMYVIRTDLDSGFDMCKEFQRVSKRFTSDFYLGDVSKNTSPSSVTSGGFLTLPSRISTMSTVSSSSGSSTRTSDGAFIIPHPPAKIPLNAQRTVRGYKALQQRVNEIITHLAQAYGGVEDLYLSSRTEEKVSAGVQVTPTNLSFESERLNGVNSPEETSRCDRATPKSSLKKTRGKGRRPLPGKTKREILPSTSEEQEYIIGINSPRVVSKNHDNCVKNEWVKGDNIADPAVATPRTGTKFNEKRKRPVSPQDKQSPAMAEVSKTGADGYPVGTLVLAKWVDKRYYSGKIGELLDVNKYLVEFDDGHTKTLLDDFIIFGNMKELPLEGQSVYATVDEYQNFEPALVLGVEENELGTVCYRCTTDGDATVSVTATELYLTEDQARSIKDSSPRSPHSAPPTPRRRGNRELDLDNIITGPRSVRLRNTPTIATPDTPRRRKMTSPKAGTSSGRSGTPLSSRKKRQASESSEVSEGSVSGSRPPGTPVPMDEVSGVEPEMQKTPRKISGVEAGPLQLKGAAKQNLGKKNSKLAKFENDAETVSQLGPIPPLGSQLFLGLHCLLTDTSVRSQSHGKKLKYYSSEEDAVLSYSETDWEDANISQKPFNKERLKEQIEAGGGVVHANFDEVPENKYAACKLIAPRPCLTAKYIKCLAADIRAVLHNWVIDCCTTNTRKSIDDFELPTGWSYDENQLIMRRSERRAKPLKDKRVLLCSDNDSFFSFWKQVCTMVGAKVSRISEDDLNLSGAFAVLCELDAPHTLQNKATAEGIPLVSTAWVKACLIEGRLCDPTEHVEYSFSYTEPD